MRGHYLSDHNRFRIRRALSLRHRPTSHHPRHEDRQSNVGSVSSRTDSGRSSHGLSNIRPENFEQTILVDDVSNDDNCCLVPQAFLDNRDLKIEVPGHFAKRHLAEKQFADGHFAENREIWLTSSKCFGL